MTTLRLLARPFEGFEAALEAQAESFAAAVNKSVTIERDHRPLPEIHEEFVVGDGFSAGEYDLFLCPSDWLPRLAADGDLVDLEEDFVERPPEDWPGGWAESMRTLVTFEDRPYALPYHDGPEIFHYREDLFESVAEQRAFRDEYGRPLTPPKTWPEFLEVAQFFTRPEEELWGTVVAAKPDGHNIVYDFLIHLWSRGGQLLDDDGRVAFDDHHGLEALEYYHRLIHEEQVVPPSAVEMESVESGEFYANGGAAMMWNWAGFGAMAEHESSAVFGRTNYGLIPRADSPNGIHTSLTVLYGLAIPSTSDHRDLAYEFIQHTAKPEMDLITTMEGASGTRLSTWRDREVLQSNSFYSMVEEINTASVNTLPQIPQYAELNDILNRMMDEAVVRRSTPIEEALDQAGRDARELVNE